MIVIIIGICVGILLILKRVAAMVVIAMILDIIIIVRWVAIIML